MMKIFVTILLFISVTANATTFYVSAAGNNNNNGTSTGTPFLTITKAISVAVAGDNILLNKGDTWNETIRPTVSGTIGNRITFSHYGTGIRPLVTGFKAATMVSIGGNLWTCTLSDGVASQNTIFINGA